MYRKGGGGAHTLRQGCFSPQFLLLCGDSMRKTVTLLEVLQKPLPKPPPTTAPHWSCSLLVQLAPQGRKEEVQLVTLSPAPQMSRLRAPPALIAVQSCGWLRVPWGVQGGGVCLWDAAHNGCAVDGRGQSHRRRRRRRARSAHVTFPASPKRSHLLQLHHLNLKRFFVFFLRQAS